MTPESMRQDTAVPVPEISSASLAAPPAARRPENSSASARRYRSRRAIVAFLVLLLPFLVGGCGISGGSIPTGGLTRLQGRVVNAEDPLVPLTNVTVRILPLSGASQSQATTTDQNGDFAFPQVPTGQNNATIQVSVEPDNRPYHPLQWTITVTRNRPATLVAALPTTAFDVSQGKSVTLSPPLATVQVGDTIRFEAKVRDAAGTPLPVAPTLFLDGDVGVLNADGTFTGTSVGSGTITAFWYGNLTAAAQVNSRDAAGVPLPPPPPGIFPQ